MRTIFLTMVAALQIASSQQAPILNPCQDNDVEWGCSTKRLTEYAKAHDLIFYDMDTDPENNIVSVSYRSEKYTRVYVFLNGEYVNNTTIYMEVNKAKLENKIKEQLDLFLSDSDAIDRDGRFLYRCKGQDITVKVTKGGASMLVSVTNATASVKATSGDTKS